MLAMSAPPVWFHGPTWTGIHGISFVGWPPYSDTRTPPECPEFSAPPRNPPRYSIDAHGPSCHTIFVCLRTPRRADPVPRSPTPSQDFSSWWLTPPPPPWAESIEDTMECHGFIDMCINNGLHHLTYDLQDPYTSGIWITLGDEDQDCT